MSYSKTSWKTLCFARGLLGCPSVCPSIHPSVPQICMNDTTIPSELLRNSAYVWQIQHNCMQMKWKQFLFLVSGRKSAVFKTVVPQPKTLRQQQYRMKDTAYTLKSHHASCLRNGKYLPQLTGTVYVSKVSWVPRWQQRWQQQKKEDNYSGAQRCTFDPIDPYIYGL